MGRQPHSTMSKSRFSDLHSGKIHSSGTSLQRHVRVGLEDSLWLGRGQLAPSNAAQVERVDQNIEGLGLVVATLAEAREMLALKGGDAVGL